MKKLSRLSSVFAKIAFAGYIGYVIGAFMLMSIGAAFLLTGITTFLLAWLISAILKAMDI
jgi:glycopeptide antibiotics resistance protein